MQQLAGKAVVLTGASQGLGAVMARALADAGADLLLAARSADKLAEVARSLPPGARVVTVRCDVTQASDREVLVHRALEAFGRVDVLVNNAGIEELCFYAEQDPAVIPRIIETNLIAPMLLARALLPAMLARGSGHIVNIASLAGR